MTISGKRSALPADRHSDVGARIAPSSRATTVRTRASSGEHDILQRGQALRSVQAAIIIGRRLALMSFSAQLSKESSGVAGVPVRAKFTQPQHISSPMRNGRRGISECAKHVSIIPSHAAP